MFDRILLLPEQEELLTRMVEAARRLPAGQKQKFILSQTFDGDDLIHPGLAPDQTSVSAEDVETLASAGLLAVINAASDSPNYNVTPLGYGYYEHLKTRGAEPVERVESEVRRLIETGDFGERYPEAHAKWLAAARMLWHTDSESEATTIGHLCREAMQAFAILLIEQFEVEGADLNPAHDVARIRAVLDKAKTRLGATEHQLLDTLLGYWGRGNRSGAAAGARVAA